MTALAQRSADPFLNDDHWIDGRWGVAIIILFFGLFLGWAALAPLDSGVVGQGVVKVSGNRQKVQHRDGGTISRMYVKEGDVVVAGQPLLDLSAPEVIAEEEALFGQILELEASRARIAAEQFGRSDFDAPAAWARLTPERRQVANTVYARQRGEARARAAFESGRVSVLRAQERELEARIAGNRREIDALDRQMSLVGDELAALRELEQEGFAPAARVRATERSEAEIVGRRAQLDSAINQAQETIARVRLEILSLSDDERKSLAQELRDVDTRLADLRPRYAAVSAKVDRARVRASEGGAVVGLAFFNAGAVVQPGERILDIVPTARELVIEAQIQSADADDVFAGKTVDVSFRSLGSRGQTRVEGAVRRISADRFQDDRTGRDYFVVEVAVSHAELERLARARGVKALELRAGLPAEVIIPLRSRTALQYLVEPLEQSIWRSFREH